MSAKLIGAFFESNLALTQQPTPPFSFYDEKCLRSMHQKLQKLDA